VAIGSTAFPYATMLLSHGAVIGLLSVAHWSLKLGHDQPTAGPNKASNSGVFRPLLAGAACGLAIACEYDAALVAGGILAMTLFQSLKRGGLVILGALPMVSLIPLYNWACLGSPLAMPYQHQAVFTQMHTGFYGIHFPDASNLIYLLFGPEQGLFFWTPFFLLAFFGYPLLHARSKPLFWVCYLVPLVQEIVMSGYYTITAGSTLGTRFFAPLVPLLILPAGLAAVKVPKIGLYLAFGSVIAMGGATVVDASLPANLSDPLLQFYLPELWAGHYTSNLGFVLGLQGHWSMVPLLIAASAGLWFVWRWISPVELRQG
jgi:hypothetical protein